MAWHGMAWHGYLLLGHAADLDPQSTLHEVLGEEDGRLVVGVGGAGLRVHVVLGHVGAVGDEEAGHGLALNLLVHLKVL